MSIIAAADAVAIHNDSVNSSHSLSGFPPGGLIGSGVGSWSCWAVDIETRLGEDPFRRYFPGGLTARGIDLAQVFQGPPATLLLRTQD